MPLASPGLALMPPVILSAVGLNGMGRGAVGTNAVPASTAWQANNRALYTPIYIDRPGVVTKFWTLNGATASANIDIGLYRSDYTLIAAIGSTAQAGTNVIQEFNIADFGVTPGVYFMGLVLSSTAGTIFRASITAARLSMFGLTQEALGSTALPATATPAASVGNAYFVHGIAFRTLIA